MENSSSSSSAWDEVQSYEGRPQYRPVKFTIGDSSDCDSVSTNASNIGAALPPPRPPPPTANPYRVDPWYKFHFHNDDLTVSAEHNVFHRDRLNLEGEEGGNEDDEDVDGRRVRNTSLSTTCRRLTNPSLAQLSDLDSRTLVGSGSDMGGGHECCLQLRGSKWRIVVVCVMVQFFSALMVSLQAPFYPAEAEKKGANATEYGFVFGVFELTIFIVAPFYGSRIHNWNPKLVFNLGIFTAAISSITFGILDRIEGSTYFIAACAGVRVLEALGESALITASFIIIATAFPDSTATTLANIETFYSLGLISGPIVGSLLYQIGGFSLPFMAVGGGLVVAALLSFLILPSSQEISEYQQEAREPVVISSYQSFRLLGFFPVVVSGICIVIGAMSISFVQTTLEPHLRQFELSQLSVGAIIIINGAVYTIITPFWGLLCENISQLKLVSFVGSALLVCGYSLVGPVSILHFQPTVWIIAVGLVLQGLGLGAVFVASFVSIHRTVLKNGLRDTPSTYGLVCSLWTSLFSLGSFLGPAVSGILYDAVGFSDSTLVIISLSLIMMCVLVLFVCISDAEMHSFNNDGSENDPLLESASGAVGSSSVYSRHRTNSTPAAFMNGWTALRRDREQRRCRDSYTPI